MYALLKTPMELTKTTVGARRNGELIARSTRFRVPCKSTSNDCSDRLKSTFHAVHVFAFSPFHSPLLPKRVNRRTIMHDMRNGPPDLVQQLRLNPKARLMQHRIDHTKLRRIEQRLIEASRAELRALPPERVRALPVERVHALDGRVAEQVLERVAPESPRRPRDQPDVLGDLPRHGQLLHPHGQAATRVAGRRHEPLDLGASRISTAAAATISITTSDRSSCRDPPQPLDGRVGADDDPAARARLGDLGEGGGGAEV